MDMSGEDDTLKPGRLEQEAERAPSAMRRVDPLRFTADGGPPVRDPCEVVVEDALTVRIEGVGDIAVMCTPSDSVALAVGFLFAEGLIGGTDDIAQLTHQTDPHVVAIRVVGAEPATAGRNLIVTSSCGMCGSHEIDAVIKALKPAGDSLRVLPSTIREVARSMRSRQSLFTRTGGAHAAAIFSAGGEIIAMAEDIGRHNALDKAVGRCLLDGLSLGERGVMLSGRISLEMVCKAARAGIEMVAAVSAPSSLAIEAADRCNMTLCGFVREDRATAFTYPHRIRSPEEPSG